jgi:TolA-binding protein
MLARGLLVLFLTLAQAPAPAQSADDQYQFLVALEEKGLHDSLVREARLFLKDHPTHEKASLARYRLAGALYELGRLEEARPEYATLASMDGFEFAGEVSLRLGQCELARDGLDAAQAAFERVLARGQSYLTTPATFLLGETLFRRTDFAGAEKNYARVVAASDAADFAREAEHALVWCAFQTKRYDDAQQRAQRFLERYADDAHKDEVAWIAGESALDAGRAEQAAQWFARVGDGTWHPDALRGAGFAAAALGDHARAAEMFGRLLEEHPDSRFKAEATLHRAIHLLKAGDAAGALETISHAEATAETGYWRARALAALERQAEALAELDRALARKPDEELAGRIQVARGDALHALGRGPEAAKAWEQGGSEYALQAAAIAELEGGRPAEALRLAQSLLARELSPDARIEAELVVGEAHFALQAYGEAEEAFSHVLASTQDPTRAARTLSRLAWCRYLTGDHAEAAKRFATLVERYPDAAEAEEARFLQARSLESSGDAEGAARCLARYLERHADGPHANEAMLRLARLEGPDGRPRLEALLAREPAPEIALAAHQELAERLSGAGDYAAAEPHYRAVIEAGDASGLLPQATYGLAWARHALGAPDEAARLLRGLLTQKGLDDDLVLSSLELLAWAERAAKNPDGARAAYEVFATRTNDEQRRFAVAKVAALALSENGRPKEAQKLYEKLLAKTTDTGVSAQASLERAWIDLDLGETGAAEEKARAVLVAVPTDPAPRECLFFAGEAWYERGEDVKASACYEIAESSPKEDIASRALYKGGFARLRAGDLEGAARAFGSLVERFPQSELVGESLYLQGEAEARGERFEAAVAPLSRVRKEFPRHAVWGKAMLRLSEALAKGERWREAAEASAELLRVQPDGENSVQAELWHGRALARLGERRGARAAFGHVIDKDRGQLSAQARLGIGQIALEENDLEGALSEFLKVALLYAHEEEVAEALFRAGDVLERQGEHELALARFREAAGHDKTVFGRTARERLDGVGHQYQ